MSEVCTVETLEVREDWSLQISRYAMAIDSKLQGMDDASGGYPYDVYDPRGVKLWYNLEEIRTYSRMFKGSQIVRVYLSAKVEGVVVVLPE